VHRQMPAGNRVLRAHSEAKAITDQRASTQLTPHYRWLSGSPPGPALVWPGKNEALGFQLRQEAILQTLTGDVFKSTEIEGERLDANQPPTP
jgi:hypothetical protein